MAQVDALRFIANLQALFAPTIADGQEFIAYIDGESNSLVIQGENILYPSSGNVRIADLSHELKNTSEQILVLQEQADQVENLCKSIPAFVTKIENISGNLEGLPDFEFDILHFGLTDLRDDLAAIESKFDRFEAMYSNKNGSDDSSLATLTESVSSLKNKFETLQLSFDDLKSEIHSQVVSENDFNVSD